MSSLILFFPGALIALGGPSGDHADRVVLANTSSAGRGAKAMNATTSQGMVDAAVVSVRLPTSASAAPTTQEPQDKPAVYSIRFYIRTKKNGGKVRCGLYDQKKHWLTSRYVFRSTASIEDKRAVCAFTDVPPGTYAASAYHDKNDNGKLDKNFLGLPKEDFTFSSGAKARLGPPSFKDASFHYKGGNHRISGNM